MPNLRSVNAGKGSRRSPIAERLAILLDAFSPWEGISLTYRQFAAELGAPVTEAAVKDWANGKKFPADVALLTVAKARERGLIGVTLEWVLWGDGYGPQKVSRAAPTGPIVQRSAPAERVDEPLGRFAVRIAKALEADLSRNECGQWSSVDVQHTLIWALKDLARITWAWRFGS